MARHLGVFLRELVRRPGGVAALAPSSHATGMRMSLGVEDVDGPIVEIGAGTGSITRAILERGVAPERLTLMETSEAFCEELRRAFPNVRVLNRPAQEIDKIGLTDVGAVISGVPVLARPTIQREVVGAAFRVMRPDGFFNQITYSFSPPVPPAMRRELGIEVEYLGLTWANLPPARVYRFRRARPH